jgi:hypothetical protein
VLDILAAKAKEGVGIKVDLGAIAGIERIDNADNDGDGKVDLKELEAIMGDDIKVCTASPCAATTPVVLVVPYSQTLGGVPGKIKQRFVP